MASSTLVDVSGESCCVCLDCFKDGDAVTVLDCGGSHVVCTHCVDYLRMSGSSRTVCPLCRQRIEVFQLCQAATFFKGSGLQMDPIRID